MFRCVVDVKLRAFHCFSGPIINVGVTIARFPLDVPIESSIVLPLHPASRRARTVRLALLSRKGSQQVLETVPSLYREGKHLSRL